MNRQLVSDRQGKALRAGLCTVIAALFVLGLTSLIFLDAHNSDALSHSPANASLRDTGGPVASSGYLRAPTTDPSLPSLEATFPRDSAPRAEDPPAPTF